MDELLANRVRSGKKQPQRVLVRVILPASFIIQVNHILVIFW